MMSPAPVLDQINPLSIRHFHGVKAPLPEQPRLFVYPLLEGIEFLLWPDKQDLDQLSFCFRTTEASAMNTCQWWWVRAMEEMARSRWMGRLLQFDARAVESFLRLDPRQNAFDSQNENIRVWDHWLRLRLLQALITAFDSWFIAPQDNSYMSQAKMLADWTGQLAAQLDGGVNFSLVAFEHGDKIALGEQNWPADIHRVVIEVSASPLCSPEQLLAFLQDKPSGKTRLKWVAEGIELP